MKFPLQNIDCNYNEIILYGRDKENNRIIKKDNSFLNYWFEPDPEGDFKAQDGTRLTKIYCQNWWDAKKKCSKKAYESDLNLVKRYVIDNIEEIIPSQPKICICDIEIKTKSLPQPHKNKKAEFPISVIRCLNSYNEKITTWRLWEFSTETDMLEDFCNYLKKEEFDIISGWNWLLFDYLYLYYRIPDFPEKISSLGLKKFVNKSIYYPSGTSQLDLMSLYKKMTLNKKDSYTLDSFLYEILNKQRDFRDIDFFNDLDKVDKKNESDVKDLWEALKKIKLFDYYDTIRKFSFCQWEDLQADPYSNDFQSNNTKIWDIIKLKEARKLNLILPNKRYFVDNLEREAFKRQYPADGAYRETFQYGVYYDCTAYDLSGCYPAMISDFCLDIQNLSEKQVNESIKIDVYRRESGEYWKTLWYKQNPNTVLPLSFKDTLKRKAELKELKNSLFYGSPEQKQAESDYDAFKAHGNSGFGDTLCVTSRGFDNRIGNTITFLPRDLLHFIKKELNKKGYEFIFVDTDGIVINTKENIVSLLNHLIKKWAKEKYNNEKITLEFDYEGLYTSIYMHAMCRYVAYKEGSNKPIIRGVQMKRRDSGEWVKEFQEILINMLLKKENLNKKKEKIINWLEIQIKNMQKESLERIAIPCKIGKPRKEYEKKEIFFRALDNTQKILPKFMKEIGERYYYIYINEENDVLAFDYKEKSHIKNINWKKMIERNIFNLLAPIFTNMKWGKELLDLAEKHKIILGSKYRNDLLANYNNFNDLKKYYSAKEVKKRWQSKV